MAETKKNTEKRIQNTINDLLALLDMSSEDEQIATLFTLNVISSEEYQNFESGRAFSLANLAFRLRDETVNINIHKYIKAKERVKDYISQKKNKTMLWNIDSQPIHWIIASLIAKELSE